jgi:hypothetical protein
MDPIIGSREKKIQTLEARKQELLLRRKWAGNNGELEHVERMLKEVENLLRKYRQITTVRRRINREGESKA